MPVMERKHSPMYFALWGFAGASLAAAAFFLPFASIPRGWLRALVGAIPAFVGIAVYFWATKRMNEEIWSDAELARVQAFVENPVLKGATGMWIVVVTSYCFVFSRAHAGAAVVLLLPFWILLGMRNIVVTPRLSPRDWSSFKPLQSEHWGESSNR